MCYVIGKRLYLTHAIICKANTIFSKLIFTNHTYEICWWLQVTIGNDFVLFIKECIESVTSQNRNFY